jgi:hypothetical protein
MIQGRRDLQDLEGRMERERDFWSTSEAERPGAFSVRLPLQKMREAQVFVEAVERHRDRFELPGRAPARRRPALRAVGRRLRLRQARLVGH